MLSAQRGFTLIELLVVIAIMSIVGAFTLANFRSFGEDQNLKNAVLDLQSLLQTAQTNAVTNTKCNTQFNATWQVVFSNSQTINLICLESATPFTKKILKLDEQDPNLLIQSVSILAGSNCPTVPFTTTFALLKGSIDFGDFRCISLSVDLKNTKTGSSKSLDIEQGGRIYEK